MIMSITLFLLLTVIASIHSQLIVSSTPYKEVCNVIAKEYNDILSNNLNNELTNTTLKEFSNETILVQNVVISTSDYSKKKVEPYCNLKKSQIVLAIDPILIYFEFDYTILGKEETKKAIFMVNIHYLLVDEIELYKNVSVYFTFANFNLSEDRLTDLIQKNFVKENYHILKTAIENCLIKNLQSNRKNNIKYDINKSIGTYHGEISMKSTKFCKDVIGEENGALCYYYGTTNDNSVQYREDFFRFSAKEAHKNKLFIDYKVFDDIINHLPTVWSNSSFPIDSKQLSFLPNELTDKINVNLLLTKIYLKSSNRLQTEMIATLSKENTNEKIIQVKLSTEYTYTFIKKLYFLNLKVTGYNVLSNKVDILYSTMNINVKSLLYDYNTILSSMMHNKEFVLLDKGLKLNQFFLLIEEITTDKSGVYLTGELY